MNTSEKDQLELYVLKTHILYLEAQSHVLLRDIRASLTDLCLQVADVSMMDLASRDALFNHVLHKGSSLETCVKKLNKTIQTCHDLSCDIRTLKHEVAQLELENP